MTGAKIDRINLTFNHKGIEYFGYFSPFETSTGYIFQLNFNGYYWGTIEWSKNHGWLIYSNKGIFEELTEFFADHIILANG